MRWLILVLLLVLAGCSKLETPKRAVAPTTAVVGNTGSMRPTLQGGEIYFLAEWEFEKLQVGDIIVVWWEGRGLNVIHRIIAVRRSGDRIDGYVTKGDANPERDPVLCTRENFVGKAIFDPLVLARRA